MASCSLPEAVIERLRSGATTELSSGPWLFPSISTTSCLTFFGRDLSRQHFDRGGSSTHQWRRSDRITGAVHIWRISDGQLVQNFTGYAVGDSTNTGVTSVAFSPDGQYLASGSKDRSVKVWRMSNGTLVSSRSDHTQQVNAVAFSPAGSGLPAPAMTDTAKLYRTSDWGLDADIHGPYERRSLGRVLARQRASGDR